MTRFHSRGPAFFRSEAAAIAVLVRYLAEHQDCDVTLLPEPNTDSAPIDETSPVLLGPGSGQLVIFTSGTTGPPKARTHKVAGLFQRQRRLEPDARWALCYSPFRWAGLSVVAHSICTGADLVVPESLQLADLADCITRATHVSLTPSLLRKLAVELGDRDVPSVRQLTLGGEWAPQSALNLAKSIFPGARISHVYASTECGDICSASDGLAGYPVDRIRNAQLTDDGELCFEGIHTGDFWEVRDGRYHFIGRRGEAISVGGALVSASTVEGAALAIAGVREAHAYPIKSAILGEVVGLDYVGEAALGAVKSALTAALPKVGRPARIQKVESISLTANGKLNRDRNL